MNNKFKLEKSIFFMAFLVSVIGLLFLFIRSDYILKLSHFNDLSSVEPLTQEEGALMSSYDLPSYLILTGEDQPQLKAALKDRMSRLGKKASFHPISQTYVLKDEYEGVIIATENIHEIPDVTALLQYVEKGGSLFFAIRPSPGPTLSSLYQQMGVIEVGQFIETTGITLSEPFFESGHSQFFSSKQIINSSLSLRLSPIATVYAESSSAVPLLWSTDYGQGQFIVFNGSFLFNVNEHALFVKGLQLMTPNLIYPIVNAQVTVLEGFPFPMPKGRYEKNSMSMTYSDYYRNIFWAGMQRIEAKYNLNYTSAFITSFDEKIVPFDPNILSETQENMETYGRELIRMGGEASVQGYNHLPTEHKDPTYVRESLQNTASRMSQALPGYKIQSYVPVEQENPLTHLQTVQETYPDLRAVLASGDELELLNEVVFLPKTASGFSLDSYDEWKIFNVLAAEGYFSHSLQPQQFLNGIDAEASMRSFSAFQEKITQDVPWLRGLTLSETAASVRNYKHPVLYEEHSNNKHTFHATSMTAPAFYFFSSEQAIVSTEHCDVTRVGDELYLVEANELTFTIELEDKK